MVLQKPRNFEEWKRSIERRLVALQGLPVAARETVLQEIEKEKAAVVAGQPTAPIELVYDSAFYIDREGRRRSRLMVEFPDVTKSVKAADITIDGYQLWGRDDSASLLSVTTDAQAGEAAPGLTLPGLATTPQTLAVDNTPQPWRLLATNTESFFRVDGMIPGSFWTLRVRAMSDASYVPGEWSEETSLQLHEDLTPPPQLTAPITTVDRGVISVRWDGMTVLGQAPPADFSYAVLAHGTQSSPTTEIVRFPRGGGIQVVAAPYYTPQFFRLAAVDESGNYGPWSEQAVAVTTPLVDTDIILSRLDLAQTALDNFDVDTLIGEGGIKTRNIDVTGELTAAIANFLEVKAGMIDVNEVWADTAWLGSANAKLIVSDVFEGKQFNGGDFVGSTFRTTPQEFRGVKFSDQGVVAYNTSGEQTFAVDAATGRAQIYGRIGTGPLGKAGAFMLPAEDSVGGNTTGIFITRDGFLTGLVTAGMWVENATSLSAQPLFLRGLNGGDVNIQSTNLYLQKPGGRVGNFTSWALGDGESYLPNLEVFGEFTITGVPTTSAPANAVIAVNPAGVVYRSTSSLRYKADVQNWEPKYAALGLQARSWVDRTPMDPADPLHRYYGLVAEEVFQVLPELVTLNDFSEPEAVQYERLAVALLDIVKDLNHRVSLLEGTP